MGLSYATRFKGFVVTLLLSLAFFLLAFFVGLPALLLRPHKFALCFTLGSLCFMASFALLRGE
jgi:ABC-type amino acid transport system permease subunit